MTDTTKEELLEQLADMDQDEGDDYLDALYEQGPLRTERMPN